MRDDEARKPREAGAPPAHVARGRGAEHGPAETDTLWTARGELPADLARIETELGRLSLPPEPDWSAVPRASARAPRAPWWRLAPSPRLAWAAAAAIAVVAVAGQWLVRDAWRVEVLAGRATFGGAALGGRVALGGSCSTGPDSRLRLEVKGMGRVELEPGSSLRRVPGRRGEARLALDHGTLHASILAPPRRFVVETRVGVATDLGCEYTLSLDRERRGRLAVTSGRVAFRDDGRESFVPAGVWCPLSPAGVGLPRRDWADDRFLAVLEAWDQPDCATGTLDSVLALAEPSDAITLWHLLPRVQGAERERVAGRIASLIPVPADVPLARVLALESVALDAWWAAIGMGPADEWRSGPGARKRLVGE